MLYSILKTLIHLSLSVFFKKFNVIGRENIPKSGPVIFVANHPSAVMDPLIVGTILKKKIHFLAGAEWIGKGFKANLYKKHFNMIPVHRPWLAEGKVSNEEMFNESYKNLDNDDWILIFPEAITKTVSKIRELKTGAIRIKDGFEKSKNYEVEVPIIPIGINYSNPHRFHSNVLVNIGEAIQFKDDYSQLDEKEKLRAKTNEVKEALENSIVNIEKEEHRSLIKKVNQLFKTDRKAEKKDTTSNFRFLQKVSKAVDSFALNDPSNYRVVSIRINTFFKKIEHQGLESTDMITSPSSPLSTVVKFVFLLLGAIPALITGALLSVPYFATNLIYKKKLSNFLKKEGSESGLDPAFSGSLIFLSGTLIYLIWTLIISTSLSAITSQWLLLPVSMLACLVGYRYCLFYLKLVVEFRDEVKGLFSKTMSKNEYNELLKEKVELIELLKKHKINITAS